MSKKARLGFFGSLGFRVFSLTLMFLVMPLILYAVFLFFVEYRADFKQDMKTLHYLLDEQSKMIEEKQKYNLDVLNLVDGLHVGETGENSETMEVIANFALHEDITAILFCKVSSDNMIICKQSTDTQFNGANLTNILPLEDLSNGQRMFLVNDKLIGPAMYVVKYSENTAHNSDIIVSIISLDALLDNLQAVKEIKEMDILLLDNDGVVLSATNSKFFKQSFSISKSNKKAIYLSRLHEKHSYEFTKNGTTYFAVMKVIPDTTTVLTLVIEKADIMASFYTSLRHLIIFLVLIIVIGGAVTYYLVHKMNAPMKKLSFVMDRVGEGEIKVEYDHDRYGFEINVLGDRFNEMRKNLLEYIEVVKIEKGKKEAFEKELLIGHQIQQALLPSKVEIENVDIDTYYAAALEVAGDFYDYQEIDQGKLLITVADGVGKGVSSCLYSFALRSILKTRAYTTTSIEDLIKETNNIFCKDTKDSCNFVTAVSGILDKEKKEFTFTNAGHLPVFVKRTNGEVESFTTEGTALGVQEFDHVETETIQLQARDIVVLYTDGVSEAMNERDELFGEQKLIETIKNANVSASSELKDVIMQKIIEHRGNQEQNDDISLVIFQLKS